MPLLGGTNYDPQELQNTNLLVPKILHANLKCIPVIGLWEEDFSRFLL